MTKPDWNSWLEEAKQEPNAAKVGMYLTHNGVVRQTARAAVREGADVPPVVNLIFSYDEAAVEQARKETLAMEGIYHVRIWLNQGRLSVGDDMMQVLIGGDTRPHTMAAMDSLLTCLKTACVREEEMF